MPIPCGGCQRGEPKDGTEWSPDQCRLCWLALNNASYRSLFASLPAPPRAAPETYGDEVVVEIVTV